jgi:lysophospholipid acyltransferase (LPLAT)-like uncharacterized protein
LKATKKLLRNSVVQTILCQLAVLYIRVVRATGTWKIEGEAQANEYHESGRPFILAFWHGRLLMMNYAWRHRSQVNMLISSHPDGQMVARAMSRFGVQSIVGSTTRGGWSAMRTMVKTLRSGGIVGITPDGPQGPRMRASNGIITIARMADAPIIPLAFSAARRRVLGTWDQFVLPLPFARGVFLWGNPIHVPTDADEAAMESRRLELENSLIELTGRADQLMGHSASAPAPIEGDGTSIGKRTNTTRKTASDSPSENTSAGLRQ